MDPITQTKNKVKDVMEGETPGHGWQHVKRVWRTARVLAQEEDASMQVVELAALLHDIDDYKVADSSGLERARSVLDGLQMPQETKEHVLQVIGNVSFRGAGTDDTVDSVEGAVVQDADRLDALGAIGIARSFAYGGSNGSELYDGEERYEHHEDEESYRESDGTVIGHFHEKLMLLTNRMKTEAGHRVAEDRHAFMEAFLERFRAEWRGEDIEEVLRDTK